MARELNQKIHVLARTSYLRDLPELKHAGADEVFTGEGEVALSMMETILDNLGATAEQIDRERAHRVPVGLQRRTQILIDLGEDEALNRIEERERAAHVPAPQARLQALDDRERRGHRLRDLEYALSIRDVDRRHLAPRAREDRPRRPGENLRQSPLEAQPRMEPLSH